MGSDPSMRVRVARAWHGIAWPYLRVADGASALRLSALVGATSRLDATGVDEAWGLVPAVHRRTVIRGIERRAPSLEVPKESGRTRAFERAVLAIAEASRHPVLALGGGLDAAAVLMTWRARVGTVPTVVTIETGIDGYDEVEAAQAICDWLEVPLRRVRLDPTTLLADLPRAIACIETPLYGLHPVTRHSLVRTLGRDEYDVLVTGDGADAVFRGRPDYDYIPIVAALTEATGLGLRSPFFDDQVLGSWLSHGADPDKTWARAYLAEHGAPRWLTAGPKTPRALPCPEPLPTVPRRELEGLAEELGRPLRLDTARQRLQWTTLHMLMGALRGHD